jgi:hypothetical protein
MIRSAPDFVIAGAMKSGTTWLHHALDDGIHFSLPEEEVHFFDAHDPSVHPDFVNSDGSAGLVFPRGEQTKWKKFLVSDSHAARVGWDSTTLFHSKIDFRQLACDYPELRIVVILRNPVDRAYSHYWHLVRTGRARFTFEKEIVRGRQDILLRSIYVDQVRSLKEAFASRVKFVIFERMLETPEAELLAISQFLGVSKFTPSAEKIGRPSNPGRYPRWLRGWLMGAGIMRGFEHGRYSADVSGGPRWRNELKYCGFAAKILVCYILALGETKKKVKMKPKTRRQLNIFLKEANVDLDKWIEFDTSEYWEW